MLAGPWRSTPPQRGVIGAARRGICSLTGGVAGGDPGGNSAGNVTAPISGGRPGTSHGSARWATAAEVRALRPRRAGGDLVVGEVGRWRPRPVAIPEGQLYEHTLLVAPNGTGKTAGLIVPNLLAEAGRRSLVIADAKGELAKLTGAHLRDVLGDDRVRVLDFLDPALSVGYNPLAYVTDAASAALFAEAWVANTGTSKEAFWDNAARTLIGAAALHRAGRPDPRGRCAHLRAPAARRGSARRPLVLHAGTEANVIWSPDGRTLASADTSTGATGAPVRLWRTDGTVDAIFGGCAGTLEVLAWSPDGKTLVAGSADNSACIWKAR